MMNTQMASEELTKIEGKLKEINGELNKLEIKRDRLRKRRDLLLTSTKRMKAEGRGGSSTTKEEIA